MDRKNLIRLRSTVAKFVSKNPIGSFLAGVYQRSKNKAIFDKTSQLQKIVSEYMSYGKIISFNNRQKDKFVKNFDKKKAVFIPHCLRNVDKCKGHYGSEGLICKNCGSCDIGRMKKEAEDRDYDIFVVPGLSMVKRTISTNNYNILIGVACYNELYMAMEMYGEKGDNVAIRVIPLLKDGCVNTEVDISEFIQALKK